MLTRPKTNRLVKQDVFSDILITIFCRSKRDGFLCCFLNGSSSFLVGWDPCDDSPKMVSLT